MRPGLQRSKKKARAMPCAVISRGALQVKQRMTFAAENFQKLNFLERPSPKFIREEHILWLLTFAAAVFGIKRQIIGEDVVLF